MWNCWNILLNMQCNSLSAQKKKLNFMVLGYQNFKFDAVSYSILVGSSQEVPMNFGLKHFVRLTVNGLWIWAEASLILDKPWSNQKAGLRISKNYWLHWIWWRALGPNIVQVPSKLFDHIGLKKKISQYLYHIELELQIHVYITSSLNNPLEYLHNRKNNQ